MPLISLLFWYLSEDKFINLLILDKTVLTIEGNEHRSFNWIMTHEKYFKPDGQPYTVPQDYLGFFPLENYRFFINDLKEKDEEELDLFVKIHRLHKLYISVYTKLVSNLTDCSFFLNSFSLK